MKKKEEPMREAKPGKMELFGGVAARGSVTDTGAGGRAPEYAAEAHPKPATLTGAEKLAALRGFMNDWERLRRSGLASGRLQLRREELELQRANYEFQKAKEAQKFKEAKQVELRSIKVN